MLLRDNQLIDSYIGYFIDCLYWSLTKQIDHQSQFNQFKTIILIPTQTIIIPLINQPMIFNPLSSRCVISDPIYKKFSQTAYDLHKQKLKQIYTKKPTPKQTPNQEQSHTNRMTNNRRAYESCHEKIDPKTKLDNKALLGKIQKIITRRSMSESQIKLHKNHFVENQKKKIFFSNKLMVEKMTAIAEDTHKNWKNTIAKQEIFYEEKKNMLRKLKESPSRLQKISPKTKRSTSRKLLKLQLKSPSTMIDDQPSKNNQLVTVNP